MAQTIGRNCRFLQGPDTDKLEVHTHRIVMMYCIVMMKMVVMIMCA